VALGLRGDCDDRAPLISCRLVATCGLCPRECVAEGWVARPLRFCITASTIVARTQPATSGFHAPRASPYHRWSQHEHNTVLFPASFTDHRTVAPLLSAPVTGVQRVQAAQAWHKVQGTRPKGGVWQKRLWHFGQGRKIH
jgi:hypothetical protein